MWFDNANNSEINQALSKHVDAIPSYKFTGLLYQLCARMVRKAQPGFHAPEFPKLLIRLIKRCAVDHPYQTLPVVFALANSNADEQEIVQSSAAKNNNPRKPTNNDKSGKNEERSEVAGLLLRSLSENVNLSQLIERMKNVALGYIKLAYLPMSLKDKERMEGGRNTAGMKIDIDKNQILRNIKNYDDVPLATLELPVNKSATYPQGSFCGISQFR